MYDATVVGARCAGSPTAMLLARKGYRVLLVDKAAFPSDVVNGCYVQQLGGARLKRWGLLETLQASNCPPLQTLTFDFGAFALRGTPPQARGLPKEMRRVVPSSVRFWWMRQSKQAQNCGKSGRCRVFCGMASA
jgi:2-polyprenyl-6-methoxyphenol hydroxylase-like FAD-dependent oxidoreductase